MVVAVAEVDGALDAAVTADSAGTAAKDIVQ